MLDDIDPVTPSWIRQASHLGWEWALISWQRAARTPGAWFDAAKADAVVDLWPRIFRLTEDRYAGQPFHLALWQEIVVRMLVGWKRPVETIDPETRRPRLEQARLFRRLMLWLPRKNGKSEFLAGLALLFFGREPVAGGQGFVFARDEKQARIVLNKMKAMALADPHFAKAITVFNRSLWMASCRASFQVLSGNPEGKHGLSPTVSVGDEMHEWPSRELATTIRQGMGARLQPIELFASTAGLKSAATGWGLFDESRKILAGPIEPPEDGADHGAGIYDPTTLVVMFAAEEEDDWRSEDTWRKANPNLGLSPTLDFLRREAAIAADNPRAESHFRRYHLNQWVEHVARWIPIKKWDDCAADKTAWKTRAETLRGRRCYGGFDISSTTDITALVWLFEPEDESGLMRLVARFWVPADNIETRSKRDRVDYDRWLRMGAIEATPGDYVDQSYVQAALEDGLEAYDVARVGFDPWNATKLYTDVCNAGADAERFVKVRQGIPSLGEASKEFERMIYAGLLDHGGHPVMRWMVQNAAITFDRNMNFKPDKERSREKIDGVAATITALAARLGDVVSPGSGFLDY